MLLGGSGKFGRMAARRLASFDRVSAIGIAGRNPEALARASAEVGAKASPVPIDLRDESRFAQVAADYDIVVNAAGPEWEALIPGLRGTIAAGTDYCDLGAYGPTTERQLELDAKARDAGIVAVVGMGLDPGLSNLLAVHASRQLDLVEDIQIGYDWGLEWAFPTALEVLHTTGRADTSWQLFPNLARGPVRAFHDGRPIAIDPLESPVDIERPGVGTVKAYPIAMPEPVTLPRYLPGLRNVAALLSFYPPHLNELIVSSGRRISRGEVSVEDATRSILATIAEDPEHWFTEAGRRDPAGPAVWVIASGRKDGRRARHSCWPDRLPTSTSTTLALAAHRILRGDIDARGVVPPEAVFEPLPFLEEVATYAKEEHKAKPLLGESLEFLP